MRADVLGLPTPRVFTIAPDRPFLDDLARGLIDLAGEDPLALARMTVLLPTRRAGRGLAEAVLRLTDGRPALLPRIHPVGDLPDEALAMTGAMETLSNPAAASAVASGGGSSSLPPQSAGVPEPSSLLMAVVLGCAPFAFGRRRRS